MPKMRSGMIINFSKVSSSHFTEASTSQSNSWQPLIWILFLWSVFSQMSHEGKHRAIWCFWYVSMMLHLLVIFPFIATNFSLHGCQSTCPANNSSRIFVLFFMWAITSKTILHTWRVSICVGRKYCSPSRHLMELHGISITMDKSVRVFQNSYII